MSEKKKKSPLKNLMRINFDWQVLQIRSILKGSKDGFIRQGGGKRSEKSGENQKEKLHLQRRVSQN